MDDVPCNNSSLVVLHVPRELTHDPCNKAIENELPHVSHCPKGLHRDGMLSSAVAQPPLDEFPLEKTSGPGRGPTANLLLWLRERRGSSHTCWVNGCKVVLLGVTFILGGA